MASNTLVLEFINGLQLGIEHFSGDPEEKDDFVYAIIVNILFLRFVFMKHYE